MPALKSALKDSAMNVRRAAIEAISELGAAAKDAVSDLMAAWKKTDNWDERMSIAMALGKIGPPAKAAVPALTEALKALEGSPATQLSTEIIRALEKINK